jgi:adenine phosphoribosyltransferase
MISDKIQAAIRDVPDFPKPGIVFKDVTPIFQDATLCTAITEEFTARIGALQVDAIVGLESRGFLFGLMLANKLNVPFVLARKPGKLPWNRVSKSYLLEYGEATIEMHTDSFPPGSNILIHDDLLATGGTASAASELVKELGGHIAGYCFLVELAFLGGRKALHRFSPEIVSLTSY